MTSPLLKSVWTNERIEKAWRVVQENARTSTSETVRKEIADFEEEAGSKIRSLCHRLSRGRFEFGAAKGIPVPKLDAHGRQTRKFRPIVLEPLPFNLGRMHRSQPQQDSCGTRRA